VACTGCSTPVSGATGGEDGEDVGDEEEEGEEVLSRDSEHEVGGGEEE
jgi:hypothetical protein